jgi:hypothetical protein
MVQSRREKALLERLLVEYCNTQVTGTLGYKLIFYNCVHGLFSHEDVELPSAHKDEMRGDSSSVKGSLSCDEVRRIIDQCQQPYRTIFSMLYQGVIDQERFMQVIQPGWGMLKPQLDLQREWVRIDFPAGRKQNKQAYWCILHRDWDAIRFLKEYLGQRGEPRQVDRDNNGKPVYEPIFLNANKNPVSKMDLHTAWTRAAERAGVIQRRTPFCEICQVAMKRFRPRSRPGGPVRQLLFLCSRCGFKLPRYQFKSRLLRARYGKNIHEMRDTVLTMLPYSAGVRREICQFFAGHEIDPLEYEKLSKAEEMGLMPKLHLEWRKAEPYLNLWSNASTTLAQKEKVERMEEHLKDVLADNTDLRRRLERLEGLERERGNLYSEHHTSASQSST